MSTNEQLSRRERLGKEPIGKLMLEFAVPSIIAMLVTAVYNIVDQIFIGHAIGTLGNAATNVSFPFVISCTGTGLLFGIGGAANFNINMGRREYEKAPYYIGTATTMMLTVGTVLCLIVELFIRPLLLIFGSPEEVLPYAVEYMRIIAIGFPFSIMLVGGGHLLRADGSPNMTMICCLSGAIINVFLDALFVLVFGWGMAGAAIATVVGQVVSAGIALNYMRHYKTVPLQKKHFIPNPTLIFQTAALGVASFANQMAMMLIQIVINNSLKHYGAMSIYGEAIPIACAGIGLKVNQIFFSIVIGFAQASQPIESFNYGAKNYQRVKDTYMVALKCAAIVSVVAFALFQLFPRNILAIFGNGSEEYFRFGERFFRIFLFCTWANCIQPATSQFYASVGKPLKGMFVSLTRQIIFLLPVLLILPLFIGIDGILYSGPAADGLAAIVAAVMVAQEFRNMK